MPSVSTMIEWLDHDRREGSGDLAAQYARAREHQAEGYADEIVSLADSADESTPAGVNKARLQVDARKWISSKFYPRVFGDRIDVTGKLDVNVLTAFADLAPLVVDAELVDDDAPALPHVLAPDGADHADT